MSSIGNNVSSVQCTLTTEEKSPLFEAARCYNFHAKTIEFDPVRRPVRSVQATEKNDTIKNLAFYDGTQKRIDCYNPAADNSCLEPIQGIVHEIGENEELVGVYGVNNRPQHFTTFGFIVRVKH